MTSASRTPPMSNPQEPNYVDIPPLRILSLCTGVGGLDLGLELALRAAQLVCCVEHEAYACEVLATRMEAGTLAPAPIWSNLKTFRGRDWRGAVDILLGGFPCFAPGTLILTRDGYRPIEQVAIGDFVLTHTGQWRTVTDTMRRDDVPLRRVVAQGVPGIITTDEHPFYARQRG